MFAMGIRYLNGWAMATHPADRQRPEWPPHPDRVFMALAAAHFETEGGDDERRALEWLETLPHPDIAASEAISRVVTTSYVPVNDTQGSSSKKEPRNLADLKEMGLELLPEFRSRQPRHFPVAIPDDPVVYFIWRDSPREDFIEVLNGLCRKVTYVGHSASLVQVWGDEQPTAATLVPSEGRARRRLRVTGPGRLAELEARYNKAAIDEYCRLTAEVESASGKRKTALKAELRGQFGDAVPATLHPTSPLWTGYERVEPPGAESVARHTVFSNQLIVLRRAGGRPLGLESTLQLTAAVRGTVLKHCAAQPPVEWVSGHKAGGTSPSEEPHVAFFPLPHVGHELADGHLLGVAIAVPRSVDEADPELVSRCFGHFMEFDESGEARSRKVFDGKSIDWSIQLEEREEPPFALRSDTWIGGSKGSSTWATVTPIVFDRHPKGADKWKQAEDVIAQACERIGLPRPVKVALSPVSVFIGSPHARQFPHLTRKSDGGNLHHTHAVLAFDEPVQGPVLIGAGRYRGYGLCRPWQDQERVQ